MTNSVVVADPPLIRRRGRELPVEEIRRDRLVVVAHRRAFEAFPLAGLQAGLPHQTDHPFATHGLVLRDQVTVNAGGCRSAACSR